MLSKEQQGELAKKFKRETVQIPEMGGELFVREVDGERDSKLFIRDWLPQGNDLVRNRDGYEVRWIAASICDEDGAFLYTEADEKIIAAWPKTILDRIWTAVKKVNETEANAVVVAAGN
jgi:hypothetical protein